MNELYVNVKVDREERPDLDALYMDAVVALTGHGGWPMTVFLTPEGEPFYGGTYFPPEPRHGLPSFRQILQAVAEAYRERPADVARTAGELVARDPPGRREAPVERAVDRDDPVRGGARARPPLRPGLRRLRLGAEVPARVGARVAAAPRRARHGHGDARRHGRGRNVRPRRRRLSPLLGRRPLARPALREDALRQRAARSRLPPRLAAHRPRPLPRDRRGDGRVHAPRPALFRKARSRRRRTRTRTASRA